MPSPSPVIDSAVDAFVAVQAEKDPPPLPSKPADIAATPETNAALTAALVEAATAGPNEMTAPYPWLTWHTTREALAIGVYHTTLEGVPIGAAFERTRVRRFWISGPGEHESRSFRTRAEFGGAVLWWRRVTGQSSSTQAVSVSVGALDVTELVVGGHRFHRAKQGWRSGWAKRDRATGESGWRSDSEAGGYLDPDSLAAMLAEAMSGGSQIPALRVRSGDRWQIHPAAGPVITVTW